MPASWRNWQTEITTPRNIFLKYMLAAMWPATTELLTDEDDVPELPEEPVTKPGDLYIMGRHRLLCGDATVITDVERLMGGRIAACMWTDPPYGVNYVGKTKKALTIQNDGSIELRELLNGAFSCATIESGNTERLFMCRTRGCAKRLHTAQLSLMRLAGRNCRKGRFGIKEPSCWANDYQFSNKAESSMGTRRVMNSVRPRREGWYGDDNQHSILAFQSHRVTNLTPPCDRLLWSGTA